MDRNFALITPADTPAPRAPRCFKCRSFTHHRGRMPEVTSGDCYDTFECSACDYVSWTQVTDR